MNRYPVWKYAILVIALLVGALYTLPNFFGEAPAVQVSSAKATLKVDAAVQRRVEEALKAAGVVPDAVSFDGNSVRARFDSPDNQASRPRMRSRRPWCPIRPTRRTSSR